MFRDNFNHVLRADSILVECEKEFSYHHIGGRWYSQQPQLILQENINISKIKPELEEDRITGPQFTIFKSVIGDQLDSFITSIMMATRRKTMTDQWAGI